MAGVGSVSAEQDELISPGHALHLIAVPSRAGAAIWPDQFAAICLMRAINLIDGLLDLSGTFSLTTRIAIALAQTGPRYLRINETCNSSTDPTIEVPHVELGIDCLCDACRPARTGLPLPALVTGNQRPTPSL